MLIKDFIDVLRSILTYSSFFSMIMFFSSLIPDFSLLGASPPISHLSSSSILQLIPCRTSPSPVFPSSIRHSVSIFDHLFIGLYSDPYTASVYSWLNCIRDFTVSCDPVYSWGITSRCLPQAVVHSVSSSLIFLR